MPPNFGDQVPAFQQPPLPALPPGCTTPLHFFKLFVDDKLVADITRYSRLYAARKNRPEVEQNVLTPDAIRTSQAILLLTGYLTPATTTAALFWEDREDTGNSLVKKAMPWDTFSRVIRCTYFVDGTKVDEQDGFWKVRLLFDQLNKTARQYVPATENVCVDEALINYFLPHPLKPFFRGRPIRLGYKVWILATSAGELLACQPHAGDKTLLPDLGLGLGPDVVYGLVEQYGGLLPGSKVAIGSQFTTLDLVTHMGRQLGVGVVGTLPQNEVLNSLPLPSSNEDMPSGDHRVVFSAEGEVCVVLWKDKRAVYLASNCMAAGEPLGSVRRYHAAEQAYQQIPCPRIVSDYNTHVEGVKLLEEREKRYAITARVNKWYWVCYTWFLNMAMVQAWRLYRTHKQQENRLAREMQDQEDQAWQEEQQKVKLKKKRKLKKEEKDLERQTREQNRREKEKEMKKREEISQLDFMREVVELMVVEHSSTYAKPPLPQNLQEVVRYDSGRHMICKTRVRGVCRECKNRTCYRCERCEVALPPS